MFSGSSSVGRNLCIIHVEIASVKVDCNDNRANMDSYIGVYLIYIQQHETRMWDFTFISVPQ